MSDLTSEVQRVTIKEEEKKQEVSAVLISKLYSVMSLVFLVVGAVFDFT